MSCRRELPSRRYWRLPLWQSLRKMKEGYDHCCEAVQRKLSVTALAMQCGQGQGMLQDIRELTKITLGEHILAHGIYLPLL